MMRFLPIMGIIWCSILICTAGDPEWGGSTGGLVAIDRKDINFASGQMDYTLTEPCFVRMRFGMFEGPCLQTVENWLFREAGTYQVQLPEAWFRYFDQKNLIAAPMAISFSPDAQLIEPAPLVLSSGHRFGQAPRVVDLLECAQTADYESAKDGTVRMELTTANSTESVENTPDQTIAEPGVTLISSGKYILKIDLDESRRRQFLAERFKMMVYANDVLVYERWDGHLPCAVEIDLESTGYPEGILVVNLYTLFDRLAVGCLPFTIERSQNRNDESGGAL